MAEGENLFSGKKKRRQFRKHPPRNLRYLPPVRRFTQEKSIARVSDLFSQSVPAELRHAEFTAKRQFVERVCRRVTLIFILSAGKLAKLFDEVLIPVAIQ